MDSLTAVSLVMFACLFLLLAGAVWIAIALIAAGLVTLLMLMPDMAGTMLVSGMWDASWGWELTALPLFIWMGEILSRTRIARDLLEGLAPWLEPIPGGLLHVNVVGCGIMAAISGSSAATALAIGRMSMPELKKRNYHEGMIIGTLAGSGTVGLLIPPSIVMIVYGVTAQQSVARLFIAGVIPGLILVLVYVLYVAGWSLLHPSPDIVVDRRRSWAARLRSLPRLASSVLLILFVIGSIYAGLATPSEAAALGVVGALLLGLASKTLTRQTFMGSLMGATRTSCMIGFIIAGAAGVTTAVGFAQIPQALAAWTGTLGLGYYGLLFALAIIILIMGCFLEGISIIVLSSAVMLPMVQAHGIGLLWFGIFLTILIEAAQITPPVGFNLYVLQSLSGRNIWRVTYATLPFFILLMGVLALITVFPELATWLPTTAMRH